MTEFDTRSEDSDHGKDLASEHDGEVRGDIWRDQLLGGLDVDLRDASAKVLEGDVAGLVEQANGSVSDEAAAAASRAQNSAG